MRLSDFHMPHRPHIHVDGRRIYRRTQHLAHLTYFALVFIEGHTVYAYTAGCLFIIGGLGMFLHEEVE